MSAAFIGTTTYWVPLVALGEGTATFASDRFGVSVELPTDRWVALGRPGGIEITPEASVDASLITEATT